VIYTTAKEIDIVRRMAYVLFIGSGTQEHPPNPEGRGEARTLFRAERLVRTVTVPATPKRSNTNVMAIDGVNP
jgi:hypothetical protein